MRRNNFIVAMVVAMLAGAGGLFLRSGPGAAHAQEISGVASSTIQNEPICTGFPTTDSLLFYDGTNWCGSTDIHISSSGAYLYSPTGDKAIQWQSGVNGTYFLTTANIDDGLAYEKGGYYDVTNNYAPRMTMCSAQFTTTPSGSSTWQIGMVSQPITIDEIYIVSGVGHTCSTEPTYEVAGDSHTVTAPGAGLLNRTGGFTFNVAAATAVSVDATAAGTCSSPNYKVCVGYYMQ